MNTTPKQIADELAERVAGKLCLTVCDSYGIFLDSAMLTAIILQDLALESLIADGQRLETSLIIVYNSLKELTEKSEQCLQAQLVKEIEYLNWEQFKNIETSRKLSEATLDEHNKILSFKDSAHKSNVVLEYFRTAISAAMNKDAEVLGKE